MLRRGRFELGSSTDLGPGESDSGSQSDTGSETDSADCLRSHSSLSQGGQIGFLAVLTINSRQINCLENLIKPTTIPQRNSSLISYETSSEICWGTVLVFREKREASMIRTPETPEGPSSATDDNVFLLHAIICPTWCFRNSWVQWCMCFLKIVQRSAKVLVRGLV